MRVFLLCLSIILLSSSSCEEVASDLDKEEPKEEVVTLATVNTAYANEGCAVLIEIEEDGQKVLLIPIELEEKFKVHGTKVSIEYTLSRIMQSECQKGRPIVLESIRLID